MALPSTARVSVEDPDTRAGSAEQDLLAQIVFELRALNARLERLEQIATKRLPLFGFGR